MINLTFLFFYFSDLTDNTNVKDPAASPLQNSLEQLSGLPQHLSSTERMMYFVMKVKRMHSSYWRLVFQLLQLDIMVQYTTL